MNQSTKYILSSSSHIVNQLILILLNLNKNWLKNGKQQSKSQNNVNAISIRQLGLASQFKTDVQSRVCASSIPIHQFRKQQSKVRSIGGNHSKSSANSRCESKLDEKCQFVNSQLKKYDYVVKRGSPHQLWFGFTCRAYITIRKRKPYAKNDRNWEFRCFVTSLHFKSFVNLFLHNSHNDVINICMYKQSSK
jgi:hypothetical protein